MSQEALHISVICGAKNASATIAQTLDSIIAQDMPHWEMIVADDGSSDDTAAIVTAYGARDSRIRLVRTEGVGRAPALNLALAEARAPLVANTDADDVSHHQRLSRTLAVFAEHPEFDVVCSDQVTFPSGEPIPWPPLPAEPPALLDVTRQLLFKNPVVHSSVVVRRNILNVLGGYRPITFEDYDLWCRAYCAGFRFGRIKWPLVAYRLHPQQYYLRAPQWSRIVASIRIQARALWASGAAPHYWLLLGLRFLWGFLPQTLRLRLHDHGADLIARLHRS